MARHPKGPTKQRAERIAKVLDLRAAGATYEEIARALNISLTQAHKDATLGLELTLKEPADSLRTLELRRLDRLQRAYWRAALEGDKQAADRVIRIMEHRAKLLGLDKLTDTSGVEETYSMLKQLRESATT